MKETLRANLERKQPIRAFHKRTFYGNLAGLGGEQIEDVKRHTSFAEVPEGPFISTNPQSWEGKCGKRVRATFPEPGAYERGGEKE
jgi:hypothetical protein